MAARSWSPSSLVMFNCQTTLRALVFNLRVLILVIDRLVHPKSFFSVRFYTFIVFFFVDSGLFWLAQDGG